MTLRIILSVLLFPFLCKAQESSALKAGNHVYIEAPAGEHQEEVKEELVRQVQEWGYWRVSSSRKNADLIMELKVETHRGMTAWSWGGVTVKAAVSLRDRNGTLLWQSREYKSNPNGSNGFNTAKATINKIVNKELKRQFR